MSMHQSLRVAAGLLLALAPFGCSGSRSAVQNGITVTDVDVGRSVAADRTIADETNAFGPADTFYVSIKTDGSGPSATVTARWTYEDGQVVDESTQNIAPTSGATVTEFHLSRADGWPAGGYKVEVFLNGVSAGSQDFKVT